MNIRNGLIGLISIIALQATSAFAAPAVVVGDGSGSEGSATPVDITVNWEGDGVVIGAQFQILYNDANLTPDLTNACSSANWGCSNPLAGVLQFVSTIVVAGLPTELIGTIAFDISSAATGAYTLPVADQQFGDIDENPIPPSGTVDGELTVVGAAYASTPNPGSAINLGSVEQNAGNLMANVVIDNIGAAGSSLDGSCSITTNPTVFGVDSGSPFMVPEVGPDATVVVSCDSSQAVGAHSGEMTCTHNGDNIGDAVYSLSCTIDAPPAPMYSSNPAAGSPIAMGPVEQGDPITPVDVAISNSGDTGTTLTGTCSITADGGDGKISVADGSFSVLQGAAADIQTVSCDSGAAGSYSATLECSHNGSNGPTASYAVTCEVGPAGGALFRSDPVPGSSTPIGVDVVVGDTPAPTSPLTFFNDADSGDMDLNIACSKSALDAEITVTPDISGGISIAPQASSGVTFSCDTAAVGSYSVTYTCDYTLDGTSLPAGGAGPLQATYTYTCDVRDAVSDVDPTPAPGPLPIPIDSAGGTGTTMVVFGEGADEGINGELTSCSLTDGTHFAITAPAPADFPVTIPAGGSVTVTVEGTDPDDGSSPTDTLTCTYTDSANPDPGVTVTYQLSLDVGGGTSTFEVNKVFSDGSPGDVTVTLTCNSGLPLEQSFVISEGNGVNFVVAGLVSGATNCTVSEVSVDGYTGTYFAAGDSTNSDDSSGCHYESVESGHSNTCRITNDPDPVDVVIEKKWFYADSDAGDIPPDYVLTLYCDAEIEGGTPEMNGVVDATDSYSGVWFKVFKGSGPATFTAMVIPGYPSSHCWVVEKVFSDAVETDNGCGNLVVSAGNGDNCTITNSVFFEGIPTLSQYGLAIMALLMLGMGLLGFRRFT